MGSSMWSLHSSAESGWRPRPTHRFPEKPEHIYIVDNCRTLRDFKAMVQKLDEMRAQVDLGPRFLSVLNCINWKKGKNHSLFHF